MKKTSCLECRYGVPKQQKIKAGKDKYGRNIFDYIPKYYCRYDHVTHATDQTVCDEYLGYMTLFEYLTLAYPQNLYDVLSAFNLKVVNSRNKFGFDIVKDA